MPDTQDKPEHSNQNKTKPTDVTPDAYIASLEPEVRRSNAFQLLALFRDVTGEAGQMWGPSIIGFGKYRYRYASGRSGESLRTGFSPRVPRSVIYIMPGFETLRPLLEKLGPHKTEKSCLYIPSLVKVDQTVLRSIIAQSLGKMRELYPAD